MSLEVNVLDIEVYDEARIYRALPADLFSVVHPGDVVTLKPNWVMEGHKDRPDEWDYVITHPSVIGAVLQHVLERLGGRGSVIIADAPTTEASFEILISRYPLESWRAKAAAAGVGLEVIDLRDHEWSTRQGVVVRRRRLKGDPRGKVTFDLSAEKSEFWGHHKSPRGYFGADYNRSETNRAHNGQQNLYSVSRSVIASDVFINLPKLKTHRKAGITSCLKNLVGINTYKNYLPHHSEGGPTEGGDQFSADDLRTRVEGPLMGFVKTRILNNPRWARGLSGFAPAAFHVFGDSKDVIRSGNWYGNDTIWRMILDLNKLLLYGNADGSMREAIPRNRKRYLGIVDAILAGEGIGPLQPEPVEMGLVFCGTNPVAIDAVCAAFMGFDPMRIPAIANGFRVRSYPLCDFDLDSIRVHAQKTFLLPDLPPAFVRSFRPHFGWVGQIEQIRARPD
ncbi:MAG: DUF362 domain-containing protein [Steroidobacteraceae bacterium]|nr:DUF362 domain-containing protein [Steroidobacteraceae bacterium]